MWLYRPKLRQLLNTMQLLWPTDKFDPQTQISTEKVFALVKRLMITFWVIVNCNGLLVLCIVFLSNDRFLPYKGYDVCDYNENFICWGLMMVWQIILMLFQAIPLLLAFDYIFLGVITYMYVAAILLRVAFRQCFNETSISAIRCNLKEIVEQHNVVLR